MEIYFAGDTEEIMTGATLLKERLEYDISDSGIQIKVKKSDEICVSILNGEYTIEYSRKSTFFRALALMVYARKENKKDFLIRENAIFENMGIMLDTSRNAVPKVSTLKDLCEVTALMGLNSVMLYTEDIFKMEKYPYFGYMRGAYSKDELKQTDEYAKIFGIEIIPCIQTLAHLTTALRWRYASQMKDNDDILLIDEPKTYEFIEEMIKTFSECLTSRKIHIGMDEADGVGQGEYKKLHGETDKFGLVCHHLEKVIEICKKYGYKPMAWGDMYVTYSTGSTYYDKAAEVPEKAVNSMPEDLSLVYWDYFSEDEETYRACINKHRKLGGSELVFAGGLWTWGRLTPYYVKAFTSTVPALKACQKENVKTVYATMWHDNASECSFYTALLGMQLYAEYNYYSDVSKEHLKNMFKICTGLDMDAFLSLEADRVDDERAKTRLLLAFSKQTLYQDVLLGLFDENLKQFDAKSHFKKYFEKLSALPKQGKYEYIFDYYRQLGNVLYQKCDIGIRLRDAYKAKDKAELKKLLSDLKNLYNSFSMLYEKLAELWYKENKGFGFEKLDTRMACTKERIMRAYKRTEDYLNGNIDCIEELEEDTLVYNGEENAFETIENMGESIMTVTPRW